MAEAPRIDPNERGTAEKMQNNRMSHASLAKFETLAIISEKFLETLELSEHIKMQSNTLAA